MKEKGNTKKIITVKCFNNKDGKDAAELIKQSLVSYVKSETARKVK